MASTPPPAATANKAELLAIADAVAREKLIDKAIVIEAMEDAIQRAARAIEEGRFARDITWSDAVLGTIEKACEGTECEGAAKWIKEEADR